MASPILLVVDEDPSVLQTLADDLRRPFGADYRILSASSGPAALQVLEALQNEREQVALLLVSLRLNGMNGVQFLERSRELCPEAKRVLLSEFADSDAAIASLQAARIHYCLNKPWDPAEEKLFPALRDLLEDWHAGCHSVTRCVRLIGNRWSPRDHKLRNFLSRNQVPYRWMDIATQPEALQLLQERHLDPKQLPVVLFGDGGVLIDPELETLATSVGLSTHAAQEFYDLVVVGGGPAGLAAGVYGASEGLRTLIVEPEAPGGQAGSTSKIENYLGFPSGITGADLGRRAQMQAKRLGAEFVTQRATGLRIEGQYRFVQLADGREISTHVVLLAPGVQYRRLDIPGAARLTGRGIYYGAALVEAPACCDEQVYVVGGANSAGQAAVHFAQYARRVTMLIRGEGLAATMSKYLIDEIERTPNIVLQPHTQVVEVFGEDRLSGIRLASPEGDVRIPATSLFVFIGAAPMISWLPEAVLRDEHGFLLAGPDLKQNNQLPASWKERREPFLLETSVPGVFVAGDVRHGSVKRVASAVGEGSIAVQFVHQYLASI